MRYVTHQFAHLETLSRAQRWLVQLGFDPGQIEVLTEGAPRIALMVEPDRVAEVEQVINAAEHSDPDGWPSFWELAKQTEHVHPVQSEPSAPADLHHARSTEIGWHPDTNAPNPKDLTEKLDVTARFE